jgi:thioredoxin 2
VEASESDFGSIVEQSSLPVLVEFWAPWCGPCRMVAPALEAASVKHAGRLKVVKVNVDQSPNVAQRFGAMSIPLMVLVRNGNEVDRLVGAVSAPQLERWLSDRLVAA